MAESIRASDTYASYLGHSYRAVPLPDGTVNLLTTRRPPPAGFSATGQADLWERLVSPMDLTDLGVVRVWAEWRGRQVFVVRPQPNAEVFVSYHGDDRGWAAANLSQREPGWWDGCVRASELHSVHEEVEDLLPRTVDKYRNRYGA